MPVAQVGDTFVLNCLGEGSYGPIMKVRLAHNISALANNMIRSSCISLHVDRRCGGSYAWPHQISLHDTLTPRRLRARRVKGVFMQGRRRNENLCLFNAVGGVLMCVA